LFNVKRYAIFFLFLITFVPMVFSLGGKEKNKESLNIIQATGVVRLVGNANFPELVIDNSKTLWYVAKDEMKKLYDLQQRIVTVEGEETVTELKFGNGMSAGTRRELKNIKIISVKQEQ